MTSRLVLNTAGIKSPLDVGDIDEPPAGRERRAGEPVSAPRQRAAPRRRRPSATKAPRPPDGARSGELPFYGSGRPLQTSIALDGDCASLLDELARAASVSANALAVAALHAGLPSAAEDARAAIVDERVSRAGERAPRIERNLRLPEHLRARIDELTSASRARLPRATRADLVNAALRRGLPSDADRAAQLVADHAQRVERAAAA